MTAAGFGRVDSTGGLHLGGRGGTIQAWSFGLDMFPAFRYPGLFVLTHQLEEKHLCCRLAPIAFTQLFVLAASASLPNIWHNGDSSHERQKPLSDVVSNCPRSLLRRWRNNIEVALTYIPSTQSRRLNTTNQGGIGTANWPPPTNSPWHADWGPVAGHGFNMYPMTSFGRGSKPCTPGEHQDRFLLGCSASPKWRHRL